jgi:protein-S-isoprenylcysteine O-methyltransferase Ste14
MEAQRPDGGYEPNPSSSQVPGNNVDPGFLPASPPRASAESILVRCIATAGVVGVGTALGAILVSANVAGWIIGLAVSLVSVILVALLWRSRRL